MKLITIIMLFLPGLQVSGQNKTLTFTNYGKPIVFGRDSFYSNRIHEVTLHPDHTFECWSRPHTSCLTWQQYKGSWKLAKDTLIFSGSDTVCRMTKGVIQNNTLTIVSNTNAFAQRYTLITETIEAANQLSTRQIDSLAAAIDTTKGLRTAVADGTIRPKGKKKTQGSFFDTYYVQPANNQLLKVEHGESWLTDNFATYYFYNDSLILVKLVMSSTKDNSVQIRRYYFHNGILFKKQEEGKPLNNPEASLQHAERYLNDVKTLFNN